MVIDLFVEAVVGDGYNDCVWQFGLVNGPVMEYLCSQIFVILTVPLPN